MEHYDYPLIVEHHEEYLDVYVWRGLPGGFSRRDLYFTAGLIFVVLMIMFIEGERRLSTFGIASLLLLLTTGFYKGFKVGMTSIKYTPYEPFLLTRLAENFIIWSKDPPLAVEPHMLVVIRTPNIITKQPGVVYLYDDTERHITFISKEMHHLEEFSEILQSKYHLKTSANIDI